MLTRRPVIAVCVAVVGVLLAPAIAVAQQGTFTVQGPTIVYSGDAGVDQIAGYDTGPTIRFTRFGGVALDGGNGCVITPDNQSADCDKTGVTSVVLNLGAGNDVASVNANVTLPVIFNGGEGNDGLFGGGGLDIFNGGPDDDNIVARDGRGESVDCGSGNDTAISDDADTRISCEQIEGDADGDGVRRPADCDDTKPQIRPGVTDIPDDGIDQDCSGADATNLDRDGDGSARPPDCDDGSAAIRPGAKEVVGNAIDENCDGIVAPFPPIPGSVVNAWLVSGSRTVNVTLTAKGFPRGTAIRMRCSGRGCPSGTTTRRVRRRGASVNLHGFLGRRALRPGARLELRFTLADHVGRVLRYRIKSSLPDVDFLCQPPGGKIRDC